MQVKPNFVLTIKVSGADGEKILAAQMVAGATADNVFSVVDQLTASITRGLALAQPPDGEALKTIADVTYLIGTMLEAINKRSHLSRVPPLPIPGRHIVR